MAKPKFLKLIYPSEKSDWLQENHPNAFLLLCQIAKRARRHSDNSDGLEIGMAHIGDYKKAGIESERKYRTAKSVLIRVGAIKICETARKRKKATNGSTTTGTKVKLLTSDIWDINFSHIDESCDERATTERRPSDEEHRLLDCIDGTTTTPTPSKENVAVVFYECLKNENLSESDRRTSMQTIKNNNLSEIDVIYGIKFADSLEGNFKTNRISTILWAAKQKPELKNKTKKTQQQQEAENYLEWMKENGFERFDWWDKFKENNTKNIQNNFIYLYKEQNSSISLSNSIEMVKIDINNMKKSLETLNLVAKHG